MKDGLVKSALALLLLPLALASCPAPEDPNGPNYNVRVTWGDYCSADRLSMDVYELLVNGISYGENPPRSSTSFNGLVPGANQLTIRFVEKPYSEYCGGYFIAMEGGALFEDGAEFVSGRLGLPSERERIYNITVLAGTAS